MGQRELESEAERARSELQFLKVSLRVTLRPNLGCQSQPRQPELENVDFSKVVYDSCQKH